jgi:hypothetical protein
MNSRSFAIRVGQRGMRVTPLLEAFTSCEDQWTPVDIRDTVSGMESQAIILAATANAGPGPILADHQVQDAIRSVYQNATRPPSKPGEPLGVGKNLPAEFEIAYSTFGTIFAADPATRKEA